LLVLSLANAICKVIGKLTLSAVLLHYLSVRATITEWQEKNAERKKQFQEI